MAGKNSMTTLTITINAKQAETVLEGMKKQLKSTSEELEKVREKLNDPKLWGEGETFQGLKQLEKQLAKDEKSLKSAVNQGVSSIKGVDQVLADLTKANYNQLTKTRTTLTNTLKNMDTTTKQYEDAAERLQKIRDEIAERDIDIRGSMTLQKAQQVLAKPEDFSTKSINEAVAAMTKFRDIQEVGSKEWAHWNGYVLNGTKFLETFSTKIKQMQMEDLHLKLYEVDPSISDNDLSTLVKYWEAMAAGADKGSQELAYYNKLLEEAQKLTQQRVAKKAGEVMASPGDYSVDEINQAIEATKKLQSAQQPGSVAWSTYGREIENARQVLERFNAEAKESAMSDRLSSISTASTASLAEQKKYWQEMVNATDILNPKLQEYKNNLQEVITEEQTRSRMAAESVISQVHGGQWQRTIGDTQEAIKQLKEYRTMMDTADAPGLKRIDEVIADLNQKLKESEAGYLSMAEAMSQANDVGEGNFDGTLEDLEKLKKRLEEIRQKEIRLGSPDAEEQIKEIDEAIVKVKQRINAASEEAIDFEKVLKDPKSATFKELEATAKQLEEELKNCVKGTDEFIDKSASLREVNSQLEEIREQWEEQENVIAKTAKRFLTYISVSGGFYAMIGKAKEYWNANLELSDSLADVQKTTGLSYESVAKLSENIDKIDTRSSQAALHELAAAAGQIGLRSETDILQFVKASNMITVSLNELGSEGTASLMKIAQLTGEIKEEGVEGALTAIGSAINELSANSAATAGPIVDFMNRIGGLASTAKISSSEMAAIGATASALGQSVEITATSMNKFVATIMSNTDKVAYALNMDASVLRELMDSGETMEAIIQVFERMNDIGGISKLVPIMGDLGSEGARMTQVLSSLSKNVDFLRSQVDLSRDAFSQATSIQDEYNVKNENAIALLERMGNTIRESVVNSGFVEFITSTLRYLSDFVNWMNKGEGGAKALEYILKALAFTLGLASIKLDSFAKALFKAKTWTDAWRISWKKLGAVMKANWISLLIGSLTSLVLYLRDAASHVSELAKAQAEYSAELTKEQHIMNNLFSTVKKENIERGEKRKLLYDINKRYGDYLGFMLKESDSLDKINAAYNLANARLRERIALQFTEKKASLIQEDYAKQMRENEQELRKALSEFAPLQGLDSDAMNAIRDTVLDNLNKDTDEILKLVNSALGKVSALYDSEKWEKLRVFDGALSGVKEFIHIQKAYNKEMDEETKFQEVALQKAQKDIAMANVKIGLAMVQEFDRLTAKASELRAKKTEAATEEEKQAIDNALNDIYRNIFEQSKQFEEYIKQEAEKNNKTDITALTEIQLENAIKQRDRLRAVTAEIRKEAPAFIDAWGKSLNLKGWKDTLDNLGTASVDNLVSTYKQLRDESKLISDVVKYNAMFGTSFTSLGEVMEDTHDKAEKIKEQLASMGRTTTGEFLWEDGKGNKAKKKAREEYEAAMNALDAYYKEREALIREEGVKENKLQSTIDAQLANNQAAWKKDKVELIKTLLGEVSEFDPFDNEGYMGAITQNIFFGKGRNKTYLKKLAHQLSAFGIVMEDGMRNTLSAALVELGKTGEAEVDRMKKILLQDDFNEQVAQQYMESLDTLGLLFNLAGNEMVEGDAKLGRQRLEAMREYADKSYSLTAEQLEEQMRQNALFDAWNIGKEREHYEVLLSELRKFHDDQEEADRKSAERRKKLADARFKSTGQQGDAEDALKNYEARLELARQMEGFGIGGKQVVSTLEIDVLKQKIAYEQQWLGLLAQESAIKQRQIEQDIKNAELLLSKEKNEERHRELSNQLIQLRNQLANEQNTFAIASAESIDKMLEYQKNASEIYSQQFTEYFDKLKEYQGSIDSFAQSMGEGIFGSKEERQEAGKELLRSVLTTSKNLLQVWLTQLATRRLVDEMEIKQTEATEMRKRAIKLQSMIQDGTIAITGLTVDAAKTEASTLLSSAEATGREVAKKGVIGLAIGAAISAALSALLGAALGRVNKAKSEIASETGASGGKLVTGMLTYASGNYPVLGNDGKVYDAQYEGSGMKTGIYRGGAHFGIFSEKKPEAIIDGDTTQRLIMNHPDIWKAIVTLSKNGRLDSSMGVRTFAGGNIHELAGQDAGISGGADNSAQLAQMQAIIDGNSRVMAQLTQLLAGGIHANVNMYGSGGVYESMQKAEKFMGRRGR